MNPGTRHQVSAILGKYLPGISDMDWATTLRDEKGTFPFFLVKLLLEVHLHSHPSEVVLAWSESRRLRCYICLSPCFSLLNSLFSTFCWCIVPQVKYQFPTTATEMWTSRGVPGRRTHIDDGGRWVGMGMKEMGREADVTRDSSVVGIVRDVDEEPGWARKQLKLMIYHIKSIFAYWIFECSLTTSIYSQSYIYYVHSRLHYIVNFLFVLYDWIRVC